MQFHQTIRAFTNPGRPAILFLLILFTLLSETSPTQACSMVPELPDAPQNNTPKVSEDPLPDRIRLRNLVPFQAMKPIENLPEYEAISLELSNGSETESESFVRVPSSGHFNLRFTAGSETKLLDSDARDGEAVMAIPAKAYEVILGLHTEGSLSVDDTRYYVRQTVRTTEQPGSPSPHSQQLYSLGVRQLPAADWQSPDDKSFSLEFVLRGATQIQVYLYPSEHPAQLPPGASLIGPDGGSLNLAGVGHLEVPAGALKTPTTLHMTQKLAGPVFSSINLCNGSESLAYDYISPLVKIEPLNLRLAKPALLYLETNLTRLGNNGPILLNWTGGSDLEHLGYLNTYTGGLNTKGVVWTADMPVQIHQLGYFTKTFPRALSPDANQHPVIFDVEIDPEVLKSLSKEHN